MSGIFALRAKYEGELSEARHEVEMERLKGEEVESLKFDNELLQDDIKQLENALAEERKKEERVEEMTRRLAETREKHE